MQKGNKESMTVSSDAAKPLIIAHRGARDVAPENTLAAFQAALDAGADGIELDVSRCASGEIVVMHDDTVDRTTDGHGRVADLGWAELQRLDAGSSFAPEFAGEGVPLLEQVLAGFADKLMINIEIKAVARGIWRGDGIEREIAAKVAKYHARHILVSSFNPLALGRMGRVAPELPCALLYAPNMPVWLSRAWSRHWLKLAALHPEHSMVDAEMLTRAQTQGYQVNAWTVNDPDEMGRLIKLGVDGLITDHPELARGLLSA